jgi:hypothetical protein
MHEYIEVRFRRKNKPFRLKRQIAAGFEFEEPDPPARALSVGFAPADEGTRIRMTRIRQVKGWPGAIFKVRVSVEDGSLVIRGDDEFSLPEGFYRISVNVTDAKVKKQPPRVEVVHDSHGVVTIDLELDERDIEVDLQDVDPDILKVLNASTIDATPGAEWVADEDVRPGRRACMLNLLAVLRITPTVSEPLIGGINAFFRGEDERVYASVSHAFSERVVALSETHDKVFPEGTPHADIHKLLIPALCAFDPTATPCFDDGHLLSYRAEGSPSLQMVIATPLSTFDHRFADIDLDLGNPLQDVSGFVIHIGELLTGKPTNHLDLWKKLNGGKTKPFLYYKVIPA